MDRDSIVLIGDGHTANAFRAGGIEAFAAEPSETEELVKSLLDREDIAVIVLTSECGEPVQDLVRNVNLTRPFPAIIEIPGVDSLGGFSRSLLYYITEALGVAI